MTPTRPHAHTPIHLHALAVLFAIVVQSSSAPDTASEILAMTGAHTRIVWAHQVKGESKRWGSGSSEFTLMGFDTKAGNEHVILSGPASYGNPSITPDGSRVVYTDVSENNTVYVVDWDGKNKKKLRPGFALCPWADPDTGIQWVYAAKAEFHSPISRFQLDDPEVVETVWSKACGPSSGFQVSADGTRAGSVRNHPNVGTIYFDEGRHASHGWGCEAGFAPDNSYRFFHMGEWVEHGGVNMYDAGGANKRTIHFGKPPGSPRYDAWNPRWSTDVRFMTVSSPNAGAEQEVFFGAFDPDITRIAKWVRVSHTHGQDLGSHAWIDPGPRFANTNATKETSSPRILATGLRDASTLQVWFGQAVALKDATATLKSGVKVERIQAGGNHFELSLKLSDALPKRDVLTLAGVFDRATRSMPADEPIRIRPADWPVDRTDLLLLWSGDQRQRFHYDAGAGRRLQTQLSRDGIARIGRGGELVLRGGTLDARGAGRGIPVAIRESNAFTLEAVITPYSGTQGSPNQPRRIISCNAGPKLGQANFALCQQADALMLYCYTKPAEGKAAVRVVELCTLAPNQPNHVVVSYEKEGLRAYLNGKEVPAPQDLNGELPWRDVVYQSGLTFGGHPKDPRTWWGEVYRVALFARAIGEKEVTSNYRASRKTFIDRPSQVQLRAKLTAKSEIPSVADIAPYIDALIVNEYEVLKILSGKYKPKRIRVAQWGMINKAPRAIGKPGTEVELRLESFEAHPAFENDPLRDTLDEDFELDLYFDVTVP
jgi:hypothetical protein